MADVRHSSRLGSEYFLLLLPNYVLDLPSLIHPSLFSCPTLTPSIINSQTPLVYLLAPFFYLSLFCQIHVLVLRTESGHNFKQMIFHFTLI